MISEATTLNLAGVQERSVVNGPGERFVLWVQGCPLACPGCFNPETHAFEPQQVVEVETLVARILALPGLEGVTYSGGEPMTQARGLALLSERLRPMGLTVFCYTGYTLEHLQTRRDADIDRLLACIDILVDGPYVQAKATNLLWRGSSNQRIHFLTDAYKHLREEVADRNAEVEFSVNSKGFTATGIWPEGFLQRLEEILRS